eukprot:5341831-Pleurochrysis_carterae.AAC.3
MVDAHYDDEPTLNDEANQLPESPEEIQLCDALKEILAHRHVVYCGGGNSLHLDRRMVHDQLKEIMGDPLQMLATKKVTVYQPSAMLEGGNGFLDLPGGNDSNPLCRQQTQDGIVEAGCIFVVLKKDLESDKDTLELLKDKAAPLVLQGTASVVFLFNRENGDNKPHTLDAILAESEKETVKLWAGRTKDTWESALKSAMREMNAHRKKEAASNEEGQQISQGAFEHGCKAT